MVLGGFHLEIVGGVVVVEERSLHFKHQVQSGHSDFLILILKEARKK